MAKFKLQPGEKLIGEGWMAFRHKQGLGYQQESTKVHVTDQRVYCDHMMGLEFMNVPVSELKGFQMGKVMLLVPLVTIYDKNNVSYLFADFRAKKLAGWLRAAGVLELG